MPLSPIWQPYQPPSQGLPPTGYSDYAQYPWNPPPYYLDADPVASFEGAGPQGALGGKAIQKSLESVAKAGGLGSHIEAKSSPSKSGEATKTAGVVESILNQVAAITRQVLNLNPTPSQLTSTTVTASTTQGSTTATLTQPTLTSETVTPTSTATTTASLTQPTLTSETITASTTAGPTPTVTTTETQYSVPPSSYPNNYYSGGWLPSVPQQFNPITPPGFGTPGYIGSDFEQQMLLKYPGATQQQIEAWMQYLNRNPNVQPSPIGGQMVQIGTNPDGSPIYARIFRD